MKLRIVIVVSLLGLALASQAEARPAFLPHGTHLSVKQKVAYFERSIHKDQTTVAWLVNHHVQKHLRWWRSSLRWHVRLFAQYNAKLHPVPKMDYWISKQIRVAELIGRSAGADPWPNCPDPIWNGAASWQDTVNCENSGNWYDSPGYFRCGLQFDPGWETKYGRLCP